MSPQSTPYLGMVSTDWNECLAPTGPFDPVIFTYPGLAPELEEVFKQYTSNKITLSQAIEKLQSVLPGSLTKEQMDTYLDKKFCTYKGVTYLINWCRQNRVLFMINTTAAVGFFQRAFAKGLIPSVHALSGHPVIHYPETGTDPPVILELLEIDDKPKNTQIIADTYNIPPERIIIIGDSGGDGPHFEWGAQVGAKLVGSMTKWSLEKYCSSRGIKIDHYFGLKYLEGEKRRPEEEMAIDFLGLRDIVRDILKISDT